MAPVVIVTGGASGIGLGITRSFASQGATVCVVDVDLQGEAIVQALSAEYREVGCTLSFKHADVSNWDELARTFGQIYKDHGRIDVVMANAGISREEKLIMDEESPSKPGLRTLNVNLIGTIYTVKLAIHYIKKNSAPNAQHPLRGSIICTASNAGLYPFPVAPIYAASKSGVIGLVRALARSLEKEAIQINALAPAVLETNIAPSKDLFKAMILTPMSTLTRGVQQLLSDPTLTGQIAEIHGDKFTLSQPPPYVDEDSGTNIETFWTLGYA
ncbi:uncharacterized protein A1O5_03245 [Cladophialophora psammophila CBS 110553]|uniref:3-oxoacyl-[acyl-carrier protein] reductase n=1 Tax=Cladophialophora psammophila CBS 110553 TaxID=1182543 RepID=W9XT73_9EURO|nr:uncharacterized protein A1O5_03245 [Cladophialophora psammophila CBS 110553]EXJ73484.1 hypothetical protein A1O5_03245 [Cladophialophora psammophila CBS 110553]